MAKTMMEISIVTHPNGYGLTVNGVKYMYFNEADLLAGFIAHVGMQETKPMEKGTILSMILHMMLGQEYAESVDTLKNRITSMYDKLNKLEKLLKSFEGRIPIDPKPAKTEKKSKKEKKEQPEEEMSDEAAAKLAEIEERIKQNPNIK